MNRGENVQQLVSLITEFLSSPGVSNLLENYKNSNPKREFIYNLTIKALENIKNSLPYSLAFDQELMEKLVIELRDGLDNYETITNVNSIDYISILNSIATSFSNSIQKSTF